MSAKGDDRFPDEEPTILDDGVPMQTSAGVGVHVAGKPPSKMFSSEAPVLLNPRLSYASSVGMGLDDLFCETIIRLHCFWDEMGMPEEQREGHVATLRARLDDAMANSIAVERTRVQEMKKEIDGAADSMLSMAKQMGVQADLPIFQPGTTLLAQFRDVSTALKELKQTRQQRLSKLSSAYEELLILQSELGESLESNPFVGNYSGDMSEAVELDLDRQVACAKREKANRTTAIADTVSDILDLWHEMDVEPSNEFENSVLEGAEHLGITSDVVEKVSELAMRLQNTKAAYASEIKGLAVQITALWDRLEVPQEVRTEWLASHTGISAALVDACQSKLASLQAEMQSKIGTVIESVRSKITELWDEMGYDDRMRSDFAAMHAPEAEFNDELLEQHDAYLLHVTSEYQQMRPILKAISQRNAILVERVRYREIINDSSRLLSRHRHKERMEEEKLERRVKKTLPSVTRKLKAMLEEWHDSHGSAFLFEGEAYLDTIQEQEEEEERQKEHAKNRKAEAKAARLHDATLGSPQPACKTPKRLRSAAALVKTAVRMNTTPRRRAAGGRSRTPTSKVSSKGAAGSAVKTPTASKGGAIRARTPKARTGPSSAARTAKSAKSVKAESSVKRSASAKRRKTPAKDAENAKPIATKLFTKSGPSESATSKTPTAKGRAKTRTQQNKAAHKKTLTRTPSSRRVAAGSRIPIPSSAHKPKPQAAQPPAARSKQKSEVHSLFSA